MRTACSCPGWQFLRQLLLDKQRTVSSGHEKGESKKEKIQSILSGSTVNRTIFALAFEFTSTSFRALHVVYPLQLPSLPYCMKAQPGCLLHCAMHAARVTGGCIPLLIGPPGAVSPNKAAFSHSWLTNSGVS